MDPKLPNHLISMLSVLVSSPPYHYSSEFISLSASTSSSSEAMVSSFQVSFQAEDFSGMRHLLTQLLSDLLWALWPRLYPETSATILYVTLSSVNPSSSLHLHLPKATYALLCSSIEAHPYHTCLISLTSSWH